MVAAGDASLSSKARRKRKAQLAADGGGGGGGGAAAASWANPKLQQRAYGEAWLAFLRLDLPSDIYKKVPAREPGRCLRAWELAGGRFFRGAAWPAAAGRARRCLAGEH